MDYLKRKGRGAQAALSSCPILIVDVGRVPLPGDHLFQRWEQDGRTVSSSPSYDRWESDGQFLSRSNPLSGRTDKNETIAAIYVPDSGGGTQVTLTVAAQLTSGQSLNVPIQVLNPAQGTRTTTFQVTLRAPKYANGSATCNATVCPPQFVRWQLGSQVNTNQQVTVTVNSNATIVAVYQ